MQNSNKLYINGEWRKPSKPNNFDVINPSNEKPFATISLGSKEDVDLALD